MNVVEHAQLALLLEVAGTPKPGNVDRCREYPDLRFEHFLAGAVGARAGLEVAAESDGPAVGVAFEQAVAGMSQQSGGNTQFGALLLVVPLVRAATSGELSRGEARHITETTSVEDAVGFYRAFEYVDVAVTDPPDRWDSIDVRRGVEAVPELRERGVTLSDVMEASANHDGVAREWTEGFERSFRAAELIETRDGPITDRAAAAYLELLAEEPDTFVAIQHSEETAMNVTDRARSAVDGVLDSVQFADDLVEAGINPGTTADLTAAGLFIALEKGQVTV